MTILVCDPRAELERFIAERFRKMHGAHLSHFCANLLGLRDERGAWRAAAGYTPAAGERLFLEQYLDRPIEEALARAAGTDVARAEIVEVGNLAAVPPGFARIFIPALGRYLIERKYRWVAFTATRQVRNLLERLCFSAHALAPAAPGRLPDAGASWGRYYANDPTVMAGCIG
jgi:hypothetical protein